MRIAFVILHYQNIDDTVACIKSLQDNLNYENKKIVVVDNASPNGTGKRLQERYNAVEQVQVLLADVNEGYARGNNLGYQYAREELQSDFIIVLNNDTMVKQKDFCDVIIEKYHEKGYHLLGPDVVDENGNHQNPNRVERVGIPKIKKIIRNRKIIRTYLKIKSLVGWTKSMRLLEILERREEKKAKANTTYKTERENVVLHGSCIVFSPSYVKENAEAFYPNTFMYFEEDILACKCQDKGYLTLYTPSVSILHRAESSTKYDRSAFQKMLFVTEQRLNSAKILLDYMNAK